MKQGLSRDDSLAVKGIAVLMLLFHHLYCSTGRFDGYAVSFFPFSEAVSYTHLTLPTKLEV